MNFKIIIPPVIARSHATAGRRGNPVVITLNKQPDGRLGIFVYLMANERNTVIYTGVTNDLYARTYQHKNKTLDGFTKKYNINKLVHYEEFDSIEDAIRREKQIKAGSREDKIKLVEATNKEWKDLAKDWYKDLK